MDHVERRTGRRREGEHLFKRGDRIAAAHVDVDRRPNAGGDLEHFDDFRARRLRRVGHAEADANRPPRQTARQSGLDVDQLQRGRFVARRRAARQERAGIFHDGHPYGNVSDRRTEIDRRLPGPGVVERVDIRRADLELERGRHAVSCFAKVIGRGLAVLMQVDKTRCDNQTACVDRGSPLQRSLADRTNHAAGDTNESNAIGVRFWIDQASVGDHEIERRGGRLCEQTQR